MARVTIEECWWSDPRRSKLIRLLSSEDAADARVMRMWRLAQEFWKNGRQPVPRDIFETLEDWQAFIDCKLAEVRDEAWIYVRGSSQYLDWAFEKREAAKVGGKKSAQRPRNAKGQLQKRAQAPAKQTPSTNQPEPKLTQASGSGSGSGSGLGLVSDSGSGTAGETLIASKPQAFISGYCRRWKFRWGTNPEVMGDDAGKVSRWVKDISFDKIELYLDGYFSLPDASLVKDKHPIGLFKIKLPQVVVWVSSGQFTTQTQVRQADQMAANHLLMEKLKREGK